MLKKLLIGAVALSSIGVASAASASADPAFGGLTYCCDVPSPSTDPIPADQLSQGLHAALNTTKTTV